MIRETIRNVAYAVTPSYVIDKYIHHKMIAQARALARLRDSSGETSAWVESLWHSHFFRPLQRKSEILRLLEMVRAMRPSTVCEIGAAGCGTSFLLTKAVAADALLIALDLEFSAARQISLESFALPEQKVFCLRADSHLPETVERVRDRLAGRRLDVLYLDGDHSYEGIKADFELYSPLVRPGGLIVFHDIVPDFQTRFGVQTSSDVGAVPEFWQELKASFDAIDEIVEDYEQDGFGIGVLRWRDGKGAIASG